MRWLLFLSKLAFICNLLFIPAFVLQIKNFFINADLASYIIIIGFVFAILFNPAVNICYLVLFFFKQECTGKGAGLANCYEYYIFISPGYISFHDERR